MREFEKQKERVREAKRGSSREIAINQEASEVEWIRAWLALNPRCDSSMRFHLGVVVRRRPSELDTPYA
eukprot:1171208-Pleurochrysis_carterae.AAC.1